MYRQNNNISTIGILLTIFLSLWSPACWAERADRDQPLILESDQVLMTEQTSTFTGNVRLAQGTMLIRGDKVVVTQDKDGYKRGTVYGRTASFRQKREGLNEYMEGHGERIEYDTRTQTVDFYAQARVQFGSDEVSGEHITYNTNTEVFQVNSGESLPGVPAKRVRAVLQPKSKNIMKPPELSPTTSGRPVSPTE